jgi:lipoprotein-anchoring transpeptidase ErfK/SrfK
LNIVTVVAIFAGAMVALLPKPDGDGGAAAVAVQPASTPRQWQSSTTVSTVAPPPTAAPTSTAVPLTEPTTTAAPTTLAPPVTSAAPPPTTTVTWTPQLSAKLTTPALTVYAEAGATTPTERLSATTYFGNTLVLPVTARADGWLEVRLPTRPNDAEGWIKATDASLVVLDDLVQVDLSERSLVWFHQGQQMLKTKVAIGAAATPTPVGSFFVTDVLASDPASAYGAWIIALDAHSEAMETFQGGDARIAIHGTNAPGSIGLPTSSGCLRADPASLVALAHGLPVGTPVDVTA